ncbi:hypothetical protein [Janthinobacterium sp.]|uniref:hypothetical protein n=1 Tax=Janthinobacterium sp. TaxID=1871054 RepID=UPI002611CCFB|nr:hypothetical protein [Janthinobacterium sp.]
MAFFQGVAADFYCIKRAPLAAIDPLILRWQLFRVTMVCLPQTVSGGKDVYLYASVDLGAFQHHLPDDCQAPWGKKYHAQDHVSGIAGAVCYSFGAGGKVAEVGADLRIVAAMMGCTTVLYVQRQRLPMPAQPLFLYGARDQNFTHSRPK